ncbi:protease-like activity factor CPAF [Chlamydia vaughanii]|uniref:protease-like activity factor CPAF n=1 Tax=Chlamydia vaughanii TaxID=3112552 RepID=UPI0032B1DB36
MKMKKIAALICTLILGFQISSSAQTLVHEHAKADLDFLAHLLHTKYAPAPWKKKLFGWDHKTNHEAALLKLNLEENLTTSQSQRILAQFIGSLNDYHAGVTFYATSHSYLPYTAKLSGTGKCYVVDVNTYTSEIGVGDEILELDGRPVGEVIESMRTGTGTPADYASTVRGLFYRSAAMGQHVPKGTALIKVRRPSGLIRHVRLKWRHTPENIGDFSHVAPLIREPKFSMSVRSTQSSPLLAAAGHNCLFTNAMEPYFWQELRQQYKQVSSSFDIGSKKGFLPDFGHVVWTAKHGPYHGYIFQITDQHGLSHNVGFVRISSYSWTDLEDLNVATRDCPWEDLEEILQHMEKNTEALIIDQTHNPGGSVFYLYGLISMLIDGPVETPKHRMMLTQSEVASAYNWLSLLEGVDTDAEAVAALGANMEGYCVDAMTAGGLQDFSHKVIKCWSRGEVDLSSPLPLLGVDKIYPHPRCNYTHPVCVLIDEECFSCGDLFPAIMKDNQQAFVLGKTTAGAGGFVFNVDFPSRTGIKNCSLTGSLAVRNDGALIENLGVAPHIDIEFTDNDVCSGTYSDYIDKVNTVVLSLIETTNMINSLQEEFIDTTES